MPTEEQQLVARARAGDDDAFDALVALHHGRVYRTAYAVAGPADVDEVVQETWVRAWRGLARFRGDAGLGTWLTRLAVNAATDVHRRRRTRATLTAALGRFLPPFAPAPTDAVEDRDELRRGLDSLDPDAGRLLGLRFGLDYSVAEIAVVLGCPEGTVKSRLHAATAALRRATASRAVLAVVGLVVLSTTIVLAGSADAREALRGQLGQLGTLVGIGGQMGGRITSLRPAPGFTVLQPAYLPDGMLRLGEGYTPGPQPDGPRGQPVPRPAGVGVARRIAGVDVDPALAETASRRGGRLMDDAREPTLVLVYGAPPDRLVELVQRPAAGKRLPAGEAVTVRGVAASVRREDGRDVYAWVEGDAFVELHTTLDRAEARRVIEGLEPTALTAVVPRVLSPVVLPTEVPLAQRRRGVEAPRADWRAAVQPCGAWDPDLYRRAPPEAYGQVMCIARAIVGVDPAGGYGLSRYRWREAAERLGVDPAAGPRPDAEVWFAQFPEAVVVLDAETAAPYVLVRLAPVDPVVVRTS